MNGSMEELLEKFSKVANEIMATTKVVNIVLNHIDPDSLASAFALKHILRRLGMSNARIRILCTGEIADEQNEVIVDRYSLSQHLLPIEEFWGKNNGNDLYALVDSSNPEDSRLKMIKGKIDPIIVIDHHNNPAPADTDNNFIWIEPVGACSTMLVKLIQQADVCSFSKDNHDDLFLPVLLALGIYTDTHSLAANFTHEDLAAYLNMSQLGNMQDLKALIQIQESPTFVAVENYARANYAHSGLRLVACAGHISHKNTVYIAKIINKMMNWRGVSLAVVFAVTDDRRIVFSVRSSDHTLHAPLNEKLRREFGESAGVKRSDDALLLEGGGQVATGMDFMSNPNTAQKYLELTKLRFEEIFLHNELR